MGKMESGGLSPWRKGSPGHVLKGAPVHPLGFVAHFKCCLQDKLHIMTPLQGYRKQLEGSFA